MVISLRKLFSQLANTEWQWVTRRESIIFFKRNEYALGGFSAQIEVL